ncbi:MAG: hypothetical protein HOM25_17355 [Rhodospirillaceae bacterium]|jgi:non-haem Fe2+, alpha-ketoglutarate-dependent halogenase|nr:hypothetical protein [Rhodospirillaceae bacterium]MBT5666176.1 hypothetical protein [Rhodospirillaceae bacterium]
MGILTTEQVEAYKQNGFLHPFPMLSAAETSACLAGLGRFEQWLGAPVTKADMKWRSFTYTHLPWVDAIARDPRILDVVEDLIGPDILVWTSTFFIKEPMTPNYAAWHQDSTYFGLEPLEQVAIWIALTDASHEAGCMEVLPTHGAGRQMHHAALRLENSINGGGQAIVEPFDEGGSSEMALNAGSFSAHDTLCVHRSAPNRAAHRRIGLGFNFIPAHVRPNTGRRMPALLVRGTDKGGHFDLLSPPSGELEPEGLAQHEEIYTRYRENYREQEKRHEREFASA